MQKYTVGFIFDLSVERVLLIEKLRPEWQAGKLNGIGGKIEKGEKAIECIVREASEECGLRSKESDWLPVASLKHEEWNVEVFAAVHFGDPHSLYSKTDEEVSWYDPLRLPPNVVVNLSWLVPMAKDLLQNRDIKTVTVHY